MPDIFDDAALTNDAFLGGRVAALQPSQGYRAGVDPVFLAAAVPARPGQTVLELGCGAGVASFCLAARVPNLTLQGVERQAAYANLAGRNAALNKTSLAVTCADIAALPVDLRQLSFDHVIANPPYYRRDNGTPADDTGREQALGEATPLSVWVDVAIRRLSPGGWFTIIQRADRLPDLLTAIGARLGDITAYPLAPRESRPATRVIVTARKAARGPFTLANPMILHNGAEHLRDGEDYAPATSAVLRDGASWPWVVD
ncbi:MAG: methyltransferase [Rhodobacteraceae bacterium]|nr:methyltransferase [Paracoccaceae bacterium]